MRIDAEIVETLPDGEHNLHMEGEPKIRTGPGGPEVVQEGRIYFVDEDGNRKYLPVEISHPKLTIRVLRDE